ncbi:hypothetical protein C8J56DRAFT_888108 [Mycena floridula]|nr:hypothetical protein C8J56DRAFT_888108 [Mycena floridula]
MAFILCLQPRCFASVGFLSDTAGQLKTVQVSDYLAQLFPLFTVADIECAAAQYKGVGGPSEQVTAIMGEGTISVRYLEQKSRQFLAILICPNYLSLRGFNGPSFKGEFAIPPGQHVDDSAYYFPSLRSRVNPNGIPPYNNTAFDKAFPELFLTFVQSLDLNKKFDVTIIPQWETWKSGNNLAIFWKPSCSNGSIEGTCCTALDIAMVTINPKKKIWDVD